MTTLTLLVLKTHQMDWLRTFYATLGIEFVEERHGNGPLHYSGRVGGTVFELYPLPADSGPSHETRLGFAVENLTETVRVLTSAGVEVITPAGRTPWGLRAVVRDPDGRTVELYQQGTPHSPLA
jgi:lactoylglutathione lyase